VEQVVERLFANRRSSLIANFRRRAETLAQCDEERQFIRRRMHQPTLELRAGASMFVRDDDCVELLLDGLMNELEQRRGSNGVKV